MSTTSAVTRPFAAAYGFRLTGAGKPLERAEFSMEEPGPGEVLIEMAGCGICHTDVGFARDGVPTRKPLPLVLGHEIVGRVVAGDDRWRGRNVIVPAVIPCGKCAACAAGRPTICSAQFMPGNDGDGGFATHVRVPARGLCPVPEVLPAGMTLPQLAVVADAVTTPWEAIRRARLGADDVAVIVGAGGIGGFAVQIAAATGAAVIAIDVDVPRLELASQHGAALTVCPQGMDEKTLKKTVRDFARQSGRRGVGLKIFEMSGTPAGQATAFSLLDFGGYLAVVGFTSAKVELRLSNLMALDATARGNWGCPPEQYPAALQLVLSGKVALGPYVEEHPLSNAAAVFEAVANHQIRRRVVLVP
jgi:6-hydroxycyclohex-1-ene-1-carbonyl-CoA dehydrogenase